jgi:hypothetical protein
VATSRQLQLDLDPESDPIVGELSDERGTKFTFTGWLGFANAIEKAIANLPPVPAERAHGDPTSHPEPLGIPGRQTRS